jgi:hypothetical protein
LDILTIYFLVGCQSLPQVFNHHLAHTKGKQTVDIGSKSLDRRNQAQSIDPDKARDKDGVDHAQGSRKCVAAEEVTGVFYHPSEQFILPPGANSIEHKVKFLCVR